MKKLFKSLFVLLLVMGSVMMPMSASTKEASAKTITLKTITKTIYKGQIFNLKKYRGLKWKIYNKKIMVVDENGKLCAEKVGKTTVVATYKIGTRTYRLKIKFKVKDQPNVFTCTDDSDVVYGNGLTFFTKKMYYQGDTMVVKMRIYNTSGRYVTGVKDDRISVYDQNGRCLADGYFTMNLNVNDQDYVDETLYYGKDYCLANVNFKDVKAVNTADDGIVIY